MRLSPAVFAPLASLALLLLGGCSPLLKPEGADAARRELNALKLNPVLAAQVPAALADAELAVQAAEIPTRDLVAGQHVAHVALRKVEIARIDAERRVAEETLQQLTRQREAIVRDNQVRELEIASAQAQAAARAQQLAALKAQQEAVKARALNNELQQQLAALQALPTERGMMMTLGDVLFEPGKVDLQSAAFERLDLLAAFMNRYPAQKLQIDGYTDSRGSDEVNQRLSEQRAEAVKVYLIIQSVDSSRITTAGHGKQAPIADNATPEGRQRNRRVEIIITDGAMAK